MSVFKYLQEKVLKEAIDPIEAILVAHTVKSGNDYYDRIKRTSEEIKQYTKNLKVDLKEILSSNKLVLKSYSTEAVTNLYTNLMKCFNVEKNKDIKESQYVTEKVTAWEFLADQLVNTWEHNTPEEMFDHLSSQIPKMNKEKLKKLIYKWYDMNGKKRFELGMSPTDELIAWLMEEMDNVNEELKYGDKRNYPKIDIIVDGEYMGTTTWAKTCQEAKEKYIEKHPEDKNKDVKTFFQKR